MMKFFRLLWVILVLGGCAGKGTMPADNLSPLPEFDPARQNHRPNPLPVHIFKTTDKKGDVKNKLRIIDIPLDSQSNDGRLRIVIFPDNIAQAAVDLTSGSPSAPLQMDCQSNVGRTVIDHETKSEILNQQIIYFNSANFILKEGARETLRHLVDTLPKSYQLTITGFTDNRLWYQSNAKTMNEILAQQRAKVVRDYLIHLGVSKKVITVNSSSLCCYIATNATQAGRSKNRRAEIVVHAGKRC